MSATKEHALISAEEYLDAELKNDRKHELINNQFMQWQEPAQTMNVLLAIFIGNLVIT
ncbi:hypothetical protein [methanotrophic endosymbiont of Bathymodiolus puteoserpentis (Logatchev)]|uniref:hypothetical protein n=1 Tax=methanotrophic endosymbiont of Bathymodiolus puteoserpentis (Logatchev) TaxID=343235 RepID=UPI0013C705FD|nr:hypothetical protein BPUTEOMOX_2301 [methanotrophic endosymbiont of Bathymodiolus puteoserpentis (Logatchev)]